MPSRVISHPIFHNRATEMYHRLTGLERVTDPVKLAGPIMLQVWASDRCSIVVERSSVNPTFVKEGNRFVGEGNWCEVPFEAWNGRESYNEGYLDMWSSRLVARFHEPAAAWYRVRIAVMSGSTEEGTISPLAGEGVNISLAGGATDDD